MLTAIVLAVIGGFGWVQWALALRELQNHKCNIAIGAAPTSYPSTCYNSHPSADGTIITTTNHT